MEFIQRSAGESAPAVASYIARSVIVNDRTGDVEDNVRFRADLEHEEVSLPTGADPNLARGSILANMSEAAETRRNSRVGRWGLAALPHEITHEQRIELSRSFLKEHFTDKGLPVHWSIHSPADGSKNYHLNWWVPMRRLEGDRLARTHARDLLGAVRTSHYGVFVSEADRWGQLWTIHQERWFYAHKLDLHVDPIAIHPEKRSYGPRRSWGPDPEHSRAAALIEERRHRNQEAARNPRLVYEFSQQQKFTGEQLNRFLEKQLPNAEEQQQVAERVYEIRDKELLVDKVPSAHRPLTLQDIARELSPEYDKLLRRADAVTHTITPKDQYVIKQQEGDIRLAQYRIAERTAELSQFRLTLHETYKKFGGTGHRKGYSGPRTLTAWLMQDRDLARWENFQGRAEHTLYSWQASLAGHTGDWKVFIRQAEIKLKERRPDGSTLYEAAQAELKRRRQIAQTARQTLVSMEQQDILKQRRSHALRSGP